jgi:hypothetical protein
MSFSSPVPERPNYPVNDVSYWVQACLGPYAQLNSTDIVVRTYQAAVLALPRAVQSLLFVD